MHNLAHQRASTYGTRESVSVTPMQVPDNHEAACSTLTSLSQPGAADAVTRWSRPHAALTSRGHQSLIQSAPGMLRLTGS